MSLRLLSHVSIINGIFTSRCSKSFEQMWSFVQAMLPLAFGRARRGLAFYAMSKQVDGEREDLFHLPLDTFASFRCRNLSRHVVIRNDYGLYKFAAYDYQQPGGECSVKPQHFELRIAQ